MGVWWQWEEGSKGQLSCAWSMLLRPEPQPRANKAGLVAVAPRGWMRREEESQVGGREGTGSTIAGSTISMRCGQHMAP